MKNIFLCLFIVVLLIESGCKPTISGRYRCVPNKGVYGAYYDLLLKPDSTFDRYFQLDWSSSKDSGIYFLKSNTLVLKYSNGNIDTLHYKRFVTSVHLK